MVKSEFDVKSMKQLTQEGRKGNDGERGRECNAKMMVVVVIERLKGERYEEYR